MRRPRVVLALSVVALAGGALSCGAAPAAKSSAPSSSSSSPVPAKAQAPRYTGATVRYVSVLRDSLAPLVSVEMAVARRWAADPAHARDLRPTFRHLLVKVDETRPASEGEAKKKAEALLARVAAGESIASLAPLSDDPGSSKTGGAYSGAMVRNFVAEVVQAYDALAPGGTSRTLVRSQFGWHVVGKDPVDDEAIRTGYTVATADAAVDTLARELASRLHHVEGSDVGRAVDDAYRAVFGRAPEERPIVSRLPTSPVEGIASSCSAIVSHAREGTALRDEPVILHFAVLTDDPRGGGEEEGGQCSAETEQREARLREMVERMARKAREPAETLPPADTTGWVATPTRPGRLLEIVRVDDAVDVTAVGTTAKGVAVLSETISIGDGRTVRQKYFSTEVADGEKASGALMRLRTVLATVRHPKGTFLAVQPATNDEDAIARYRSFVAREPVIVDDRDVASATFTERAGEPVVMVELRPEAAQRFAEATAAWTGRRVAILLDGVVATAPVIREAVPGGRVSILPGAGTPEARRAAAERLVRGLSAPRAKK